MLNRASAIYGYGISPKANFEPPSEDHILEIPLSEFQHVLEDLVSVYNQLAETVRDAGIIREESWLGSLRTTHEQ